MTNAERVYELLQQCRADLNEALRRSETLLGGARKPGTASYTTPAIIDGLGKVNMARALVREEMGQ